MNLINPYRDTLATIPYLNEALDLVLAKINAIWNVEHDENGHHHDITVTEGGVTAEGAGTFTGNLTAQSGDADYECELGNLDDIAAEPVERGIRLGGTTGYEIIVRPASAPGTSGDEVRAYHLSKATDAPVWRWVYDAANTTFRFMPYSGAAGTAALGNDASGSRWFEIHGTDVYASAGYHERGRTARVGEWTAVTHAGGNFTANGGATWTVDAGDQVTFAYAIVGKTLTVAVSLNGTSIVTAAPSVLSVAIPGGFTAARSMRTSAYIADTGVDSAGIVSVAASGTTMTVQKLPSSGTFAIGANTLDIWFIISFEVQ